MANKKISQLTAKGTAIAATDLVEISESDGAGGYVTKSVTGANILSSKQDTLVSGTNIKTINGSTILGSGNLVVGPSYQAISNTLGTIITGTTNAISDFLLLPANTLSSNCQFELQWYPRKTNSEAATTQGLVYINSINSLTGATLFATGASMSTAGLFQVTLRRTVCVRSNVATLISTSTQTGSDFSTSLYSDVAFNNSSDIYFLFVMNNTGPLLASRNGGYRLLGYNL